MARPVGRQAEQERKLLKLLTALTSTRTYCNATSKFLARRMGCSERSISRYFAGLRRQGLLRANYFRRPNNKGAWVTKRYCRPITAERPATWAPVFHGLREPDPAVVEMYTSTPVSKTVEAPAKTSSWGIPFYPFLSDFDEPLAIRMKEKMEQIRETQAIDAAKAIENDTPRNKKLAEEAIRRWFAAEEDIRFKRRKT